MSTRARIFAVVALVTVFTLMWLPVANAYVDPGSGSFVFQALIGGLLAASVTLKLFWKRIVAVVMRKDHSAPDA